MIRSYRIIPCYTGDVSGTASALYELGGMVVIHDPSGCNSTYNTHDETRWYDHDSLIFISGLSQTDAILGNDEKFIQDIEEAARELHPRFIALASCPIPYMNGTDFEAIARILEEDLGIPAFFVRTNGMHDYVTGAGNALVQAARYLLPGGCRYKGELHEENCDCEDCKSTELHEENCDCEDCKSTELHEEDCDCEDCRSEEADDQDGNSDQLILIQPDEEEESDTREERRPLVNILGMTPLDFAARGSVRTLKNALFVAGFQANVCWAMNSTLEDLQAKTRLADVNLVVSAMGIPLAKELQKIYGTPYVVGLPVGRFAPVIWREIRKVISEDKAASNSSVLSSIRSSSAKGTARHLILIGEPVTMGSIGCAYSLKHPEIISHVICPLEVSGELMGEGDFASQGEEDIEEYLKTRREEGKLDMIAADPLYRPICPQGVEFVELPHEAFSGRCFQRSMKNLIDLRP